MMDGALFSRMAINVCFAFSVYKLCIYIIYVCHCIPAGSEGTHFAFSFPLGNTEFTYETEIRITSREEANVTLLGVTLSDVIIVPGRGYTTYVGDPSQRVVHGLEDKGFELKSDTPVSVTIGCPDYDDQFAPDSMLLRPLSADQTDFVITSFIGSRTGYSYAPLSFFSITASDDDTTISIYDNNGASYTTQSLNRLVTFLIDFTFS